ncbi:uncharacterized protein JCM10292_002726 [Rhodotorula paludigena]|uniref:uncharacterized protein n=1 Tax=Rhodotorula paludigena TaxID=86838 RepID=UPI00317D26C0
MDLPPAQQVRVAQQRPSVSYFLFLALLVYLMNTNAPTPASVVLQNGAAPSYEQAYARARHNLLVREARQEGLARWLGESNATGEYLASAYFPDQANGSAPAPLPRPANDSSSDTDAQPEQSETYRIIPFEPDFNATELRPVPPLVADLFAHNAPKLQDGHLEPRVHPQNLTGFAKGPWSVRPFSFDELGLNETWSVERVVEHVVEDDASPQNETESAGEVASSLSTRLIRRAEEGAPLVNATTPAQVNLTTVVDVYNRTTQRGTFPWLSALSSSPAYSPARHRATFNLRSEQSSATGPIVPRSSNADAQDWSELLRMRDEDPARWDEWEREGPVVYVSGDLTLRMLPEEGSSEDERVTELDVEAVHFLSSGRVYGYATPSFVGTHVFNAISLPYMSSPSPTAANRTAHAIAHAMLKEYKRRLAKHVRELEDSGPSSFRTDTSGSSDSDDSARRVPTCIFSLYGSLAPLPASYTPALYAEYYRSLFLPQGTSVRPPPPAHLSALLASDNCALVLDVPSAEVTLTQALWNEAARFAVLLVAPELAALVLLVRQLERVQSRSGTIANVALLGIAAICIVDLYVFVTLLMVSVLTDSHASLPLACASFLSCLASLVFGGRYINMIREATPERPSPPPAPARPAEPVVVNLAPADAVLADAEGTVTDAETGQRLRAPRQDVPFVSWSVRERIYAATALGTFAFALYLILYRGWMPFFLWLIYSYWIPQIVTNVYRGTARQSLAGEYIVGTTIARLATPVYFWGYGGNCLMVEATPKIFYLVAYSGLQAVILLLQARFSSSSSRFASAGARFFVPSFLIHALELPAISTWNYHPRDLPASLLADLSSDLEAGKAAGGAAAPEPDCPICLTGVQLLPTKLELEAGQGDAVRAQCAVTPCAHVVHTECLEQWMQVRAVCPVCRASLPPLGG